MKAIKKYEDEVPENDDEEYAEETSTGFSHFFSLITLLKYGAIVVGLLIICPIIYFIYYAPTVHIPSFSGHYSMHEMPEWIWLLLAAIIASIVVWMLFPRIRNLSIRSAWSWIWKLILAIALLCLLYRYSPVIKAWWENRKNSSQSSASGNSCCAAPAVARPSYPLIVEGQNPLTAGETYRYHRKCKNKYYFNPTEGTVRIRFTYEDDPARWYECESRVSTLDFVQGDDPFLDGDYLVTVDRNVTLVMQEVRD
ncbi:MAG: hypothetical protein V4478_02775 [Patescibacteria group bacterium]